MVGGSHEPLGRTSESTVLILMPMVGCGEITATNKYGRGRDPPIHIHICL